LKIKDSFTSLNDLRSEVATETNAVLETKWDKNRLAVRPFGGVKTAGTPKFSGLFTPRIKTETFV
jgi:hypothetical protein